MNINIFEKPMELDTVATGHRIKDLMKEKEISVRKLSKFMNVTFQAIYCWQKGEALPTIKNLFILGQLLEIDVDDILILKEKK